MDYTGFAQYKYESDFGLAPMLHFAIAPMPLFPLMAPVGLALLYYIQGISKKLSTPLR